MTVVPASLIKRLRRGIIWAAKAAARAGSAARRIATDTDTYFFGGLLLVATGVGAMHSIPLAAIITGCALIAFAVWMTPRAAGRSRAGPSGTARSPEEEL